MRKRRETVVQARQQNVEVLQMRPQKPRASATASVAL